MAVGIWASPPEAPIVAQTPYVACIDGHIAKTLDECPAPRSFASSSGGQGSGGPRSTGGGGGGGRGGLLGLGIAGIL